MNPQTAIDIFVNERLVFGDGRHIQARDAIRKLARSHSQKSMDMLTELRIRTHYKYTIQQL